MPSHVARLVWQKGASHLEKDAILISFTKGIEVHSLKLMNQVLEECLPHHPSSHCVALSGPSFAAEVAAGLPTSVTIAGEDPKISKRVQDIFRTDVFLTFTNEDIIGVEVGGAVKNVIAIATGVAWGLNLGYNARAAIITRGLYEMIKIGKALGANPLTFTGLSGIGDLVLTCTGELSRNYRVGMKLGQGQSLDQITKDMRMVAEGVHTAKAVYELAQRNKINIPICESIYRILFEGLDPNQAVKELGAMPLRAEMGALLKGK
jgi:glycerol-3-phosphate dehydrogenase (NAD(P)+)